MSECPAQKKCEKGSPAWVMTFADLMSLLMCFFVLLLSFSEMDLQKYKQVAGSMRMAFGVQRDIETEEIPKGTSIIAQEFSPGRPTPTPLPVIRQQTTDELRPSLDFTDARVRDLEEEAQRLREALATEIEDGRVDVESQGERIIVRIQEKTSFPSGKAQLTPSFRPILGKIARVLVASPGRIVVAGHTDDVPISTARFRSNWELSAARAVSVAHELLRDAALDPGRLLIEGHADAHPLVPNDSPAGRARNRRVEIVLIQGEEREAAPMSVTNHQTTNE